jgi:hypothetical protein
MEAATCCREVREQDFGEPFGSAQDRLSRAVLASRSASDGLASGFDKSSFLSIILERVTQEFTSSWTTGESSASMNHGYRVGKGSPVISWKCICMGRGR